MERNEDGTRGRNGTTPRYTTVHHGTRDGRGGNTRDGRGGPEGWHIERDRAESMGSQGIGRDGTESESAMQNRRVGDGTFKRPRFFVLALASCNFCFPGSADLEQDWQPYPVDPYPCYMEWDSWGGGVRRRQNPRENRIIAQLPKDGARCNPRGWGNDTNHEDSGIIQLAGKGDDTNSRNDG